MPTFEEIQKQIQQDLLDKTSPSSPDTVEGDTDIVHEGYTATAVPVRTGTVVSAPGSERVTLQGSSFQLMECESAAKKGKKKRYCFIELDVKPVFGNQFMDSKGNRCHILTQDLYMVLLALLRSASKQIKELGDRSSKAEEQRDLYKLTIDALKKHGIID